MSDSRRLPFIPIFFFQHLLLKGVHRNKSGCGPNMREAQNIPPLGGGGKIGTVN